jgi:hypothetical protein
MRRQIRLVLDVKKDHAYVNEVTVPVLGLLKLKRQ